MTKHWYHWMLWGRLGYDPTLSNDRLVAILAARFPEVDAAKLFTAWQEASMVYPVVTGFHWGALDFQWYIEGCISRSRASDTESGFHDIERFITLGTHPGTDNLTIPEYVQAVVGGDEPQGTTPLEVSQQVHAHADRALKIVERFEAVEDETLDRTLGDIRAMANLGKYYAHKIRGATELALYRQTGDESRKAKALDEMNAAAGYWDRYLEIALAQYVNPIHLNRVGKVDWTALTAEVKKDIEIVKNATPGK